MPSKFPTDPAAKRSALLAAAESIREIATLHAQEAEAMATLPPATVKALADSGLLAMKLPAVLGGAEADLVTQIEVLEALSEIDSSVGWCTMIGATAIGLPGAFLPDEAIAQIFAGGRIPLAAIIAAPAGRATATDGGYRLSGRWSFVSGVRHAQWIMVGAQVKPDGAPPRRLLLAIPAAAVQIHDNWQVAGLEGTGSCDISVDDYFVPESFAWDPVAAPPLRGGALYRLRNPGFVANEHAAFALGLGRRALGAVTDIARSKHRGVVLTPSSLQARPVFQRTVAHCDMRLRAARALVMEVFAQAWEVLCSGHVPPPQMHAQMRGVAAFATEVAADVVTQVFRYAGGSEVYRTQPLQRCLRDINVAAQHYQMSDIAYETYGQFALGLADAEPMH